MDNNIKAFWEEICLDENRDIQEKLFRLDYIKRNVPEDDSIFQEMIEELEEIDNPDMFLSPKEHFEFIYIVKNTEWLFSIAGEAYGIIFDNVIVSRGTEIDVYVLLEPLYNFPFIKLDYDSWEEIIKEGETWCPNYKEIFNKYFSICKKYGYEPSLPKENVITMSYEDFDKKLFKDFKE